MCDSQLNRQNRNPSANYQILSLAATIEPIANIMDRLSRNFVNAR